MLVFAWQPWHEIKRHLLESSITCSKGLASNVHGKLWLSIDQNRALRLQRRFTGGSQSGCSACHLTGPNIIAWCHCHEHQCSLAHPLIFTTFECNESINFLKPCRERVVGGLRARRCQVRQHSCKASAALRLFPCPRVWLASMLQQGHLEASSQPQLHDADQRPCNYMSHPSGQESPAKVCVRAP
jgi:hypothetical protein